MRVLRNSADRRDKRLAAEGCTQGSRTTDRTDERMSKRFAPVLALSLLVGCGASMPTVGSPKGSEGALNGSTEPSLAHTSESGTADEASPKESAQRAPEEAPIALEIPKECESSSAKLCTPAASFVEKLCQAKSADVALAMFRKSTPWMRAYLRHDTNAWYMGARRSSPVQLVVDEEVIVVANRSSSGSSGIQVSGTESYDVYRWDGKCVSLTSDEITLRRPSAPRSAPIAWASLTDAMHAALLDDRKIKSRLDHLQHDRCDENGSAPRCMQATADLARLIADYVRRGQKLPDTRLTAR